MTKKNENNKKIITRLLIALAVIGLATLWILSKNEAYENCKYDNAQRFIYNAPLDIGDQANKRAKENAEILKQADAQCKWW